MDNYELKVQKRTILGKKVKSLRRQKLIPAVIFASPKDVVHITIDQSDVQKTILKAGITTLIDVVVDGEKSSEKVLVSEVQYDQRTLQPIHVSLHKVNLKEEIATEVPIELVGEPEAIKLEGGILINPIQELEVRCLPQNIPHSLEIDVTNLAAIGDSITIADITLPKGVTLVHQEEEDLQQVVALITHPQKEEEEVEEEVSPEDVEISTEKGKEGTEEDTPEA